jgi:high-affinity iron transporter
VKLNFNFKLTWAPLVLGLLGGGSLRAGLPIDSAPLGDDAQRVVALVDYVKGDYPGAVREGSVVAPSEYEEQLRFVADARSLAVKLLPDAPPSDPLLQGLAQLDGLVHKKADPEDVRKACLAVRDQAIGRFKLRTTPSERPNLARAEAAYAESCAVCHAPRGNGATERALTLDPRPASFKDPNRLGQLSPYRVFNALTFGVAGTAMPSFEALTPSERWDLAFFVFRLGHEADPSEAPATRPLADLAIHSDYELLASLRSEPSPTAALAFLRREAPFREPPTGASIDRTRYLLRRAVAAYRSGQRAEADRGVLDAYLQGFEPLEAPLRVHDPSGTSAVETAFRDLRVAIAAGADPRDVDVRGAALETQLFELAEGGQRPLVPILASATIFFREGLEAALVVGALLAGVRKLGRPDATRFLHAGWVLALPAGVLTWFALERLLVLGSDQRELLEGVVSLVAALVLFSVSFWMISKAESRHWMAYLQRNLEERLSQRRLLLLAGLAFLAVYREAAETVLFLQALLLESPGERTQILLGAVLGLAFVFLVALLMNRTVLRLPLGPFFAVSGVLLCALAISFAGAGIYILVASGYLPPRPVPFPEVSWMGIHPDLTGLLVQLTILLVTAAAGVHALRRRGAPSPEKPR